MCVLFTCYGNSNSYPFLFHPSFLLLQLFMWGEFLMVGASSSSNFADQYGWLDRIKFNQMDHSSAFLMIFAVTKIPNFLKQQSNLSSNIRARPIIANIGIIKKYQYRYRNIGSDISYISIGIIGIRRLADLENKSR